MEKGTILDNRKYVIGGIILVIVVSYIIRLANLQLFSDEYKTKADSNAYYRNIIYPSRGNIYDRNGELLVYNQQAYDIMVTTRDIKNLDTLEFCKTLGISRETFEKRMADIKDRTINPGYSSYTAQLFVGQLSEQEHSVLQEKLIRYPGFTIRQRMVRKYAYPYLAHVLGDVGEVSREDIDNDDYYSAGDFIGKQGVERSYEKELRGEKGVQIQLRDARGRVHGKYKNGEEDIKPKPGKDVTLAIDVKLQALGERLMTGKRGAIVAIEPHTGEILCMVSSPTYDPRLLEGKERGKYIGQLMKDKSNPLLNRAMLGAYPPGSTFKPTQALTYLQEHIITSNTYYPCVRGFKFQGMKVGCHPHTSPINLTAAIATSCNGYFCWGLYNMFSNRKQYPSLTEAMTKWKNYMVSMGFGYKLGVDLPSEARGLIPNAQFYDKAYKGRWNPLTVISISIGQGEVLATPIQIANLAATVANRGKYKVPHVVHDIQDGTVADTLTTFKRTMVDPGYYNYVVQGMRGAVLKGTCVGANIPGYEVCGKTGTAQNPHGQDHSAFMGFAPMNNPKIAICVYVENGEWGATYGVPIGALMMEQYLKGELSESAENMADRFEHKKISYTEQKPKPETKEEPKKEEEKKDSVAATKKKSVFHHPDSLEGMVEKKPKVIDTKAKDDKARKAELEKIKSEEEKRKIEEARMKAEIRQKAELARKKAAEMRRQEDTEKSRHDHAVKQKRKQIFDQAMEADRIVRRMREKMKR